MKKIIVWLKEWWVAVYDTLFGDYSHSEVRYGDR